MHPAGAMLVAQMIDDERHRLAALRRLWSPKARPARAAATRPALDIAGLMRLRFRFGA